jgi:hypothetical protein
MSRIVEIVSTGLDEYIQGIGSDPFGSSSSFGLRVPTLATPNAQSRYLFLLASFSLNEGQQAKILGYRQFSSLGAVLAPGRFVEQPISSENFRLPDGNISWHLQRLGPPNAAGYPKVQASKTDLNSFSRNWADHSCLLYQKYTIAAGNRLYPQLTSYIPPNGGKPWGSSIPTGHQPTFYDQRAPWRAAETWQSLDMFVEGPCTIAFFASVRQSTGRYDVAASPLVFPNGLSDEEQFMGNFGGGESPRPIYWRVGGALILEQ